MIASDVQGCSQQQATTEGGRLSAAGRDGRKRKTTDQSGCNMAVGTADGTEKPEVDDARAEAERKQSGRRAGDSDFGHVRTSGLANLGRGWASEVIKRAGLGSERVSGTSQGLWIRNRILETGDVAVAGHFVSTRRDGETASHQSLARDLSFIFFHFFPFVLGCSLEITPGWFKFVGGGGEMRKLKHGVGCASGSNQQPERGRRGMQTTAHLDDRRGFFFFGSFSDGRLGCLHLRAWVGVIFCRACFFLSSFLSAMNALNRKEMACH